MTANRSLVMVLTCGALAGVAGAQQIPPQEDGPPIVTAKLVNGEAEVRDADTGAPIVMPKGVGLWRDHEGTNSLQPTIEFQAQPAGYDIIYTYNNTGKTARTLGALNAGIFTLGPKITYPNLCKICEPLTADLNNNYHAAQAHYPRTVYSPAWVLENKDYAVGVSIQYPILEYKHDVRLCLLAPDGHYADGDGGRGWRLEFLLSNLGNETDDNRLLNSGKIAPGDTRTYVISVRVTRNPQEWVRTLVPYRNWFRSEYGGVEYVRDPRPINGRSTTTPELCSDDNPYGFGVSRPDKNGWGGIVSNLMERSGWGTELLWTTSGSYRHNLDNNMPFQFTTNWKATPALATATDPKIGFPRIPASGQPLGLWWGRSCQVADKWDDATLEPLDPHNKAHRAAAFAEMDLAVKAGATTIGLDTFSTQFTPIWDLLGWIDDLKARYPGVRFCAEPVTCDLVHRKIATYYRGNNDRYKVKTPDEIDGFWNPFYIADFLLPGHETWGAFRWNRYADWFGMTFTDQQKEEKLQQIASMGYVPLALCDFNCTVNADAAKSWEFTVPADLREGKGGPGKPNGDLGSDGKSQQNNTDPFPTFDSFETAFNAGDMRTDLNHDGKLDFFDFTAWQNAHTKGGKGNAEGGKGGGGDNGGKSGGGSVKNTKAAPPRMQLTVRPAPKTGGIVGSLGDGRSARPLSFSFTQAEIRAAIARARGLQEPAATTASVPDDNH